MLPDGDATYKLPDGCFTFELNDADAPVSVLITNVAVTPGLGLVIFILVEPESVRVK